MAKFWFLIKQDWNGEDVDVVGSYVQGVKILHATDGIPLCRKQSRIEF